MANALAWVSSPVSVNYILQQDFEGAGTPPGWNSTGAVTFHNTASPLEGTGDLKLLGQSSPLTQAFVNTSASASEVWMVALVKLVALPSAGGSQWMAMYSAGFATSCADIRVSSAGVVTCTNKGVSVGNMASSVVAGTLYYLKIHYKKGSGADSQSSYELSTTGNWIGSGGFFVSTTTGTCMVDVAALNCWYNVDGESRYDHIRISTTDGGNSFSNWP